MPEVKLFRGEDGKTFYRDPKSGEQVFVGGEPSAMASAARGALVTGPSSFANQIIDSTGGGIGRIARTVAEQAGFSPQQALEQLYGKMTGLSQEPQSPGGRLAQAVGQGVFEAPIGAAGPLTAGRAALELGTSVAGNVASQLAGNAGAGVPGQIAASVLTGGTIRGAAGLAGSAGRGAARMLSSSVRGKAAEQMAAESLRGEVPAIVQQQARQALDAEMRTPLFGKATTEQVLSEVAPGIRFKGDIDPALRLEVHNLRKANAQAARDFGDRMLPGGQPTAAIQEYETRLDKIHTKFDKAYAKVGDIEGLPIEPLDKAAAFVRTDAGKQTHWLPQAQLDIIDKFQRQKGFVAAGPHESGPITVREADLKDLQNLSSDLFETASKASQAGDLRKARYANLLRDGVEKTLDDAAAAGGMSEVNALRKARAMVRATAAPKTPKAERAAMRPVSEGGKVGFEFRQQHPLWRVFNGNLSDEADMQKDFGAFLRKPNAAATLGRLKLSLGGNPEAWGGVRQLARNEIFGENFDRLFKEGDLNTTGAESVLQTINKRAASMDALWGPGTADNAKQFVQRARQLADGTRVERFSTLGVADPRTGQQLDSVSEIATKNIPRASIRLFSYVTGRLPNTREEANKLLMLAVAKPEIAEGFLRPLKPHELITWKQRTMYALARELSRGASGVQTPPQQ